MTVPAAPYSLGTLLTPQQLADLRAQLLAFLQAQDFPALTEWAGEPTGLEMSFVDMICKSINDLAQSNAPIDQQIASAAAAHFLGYAAGGWLDILAWEVYQLIRDKATKTTFTLTLISVDTAPPYTYQPGDVRVTGPTGNEYISTTAADLEPGGQVEVSFEAVGFGSAFDDDPLSGEMQLVTADAGVSISTAVGDFTVVANAGGSTGILTPVRTDPAIVPTPRSFSIKIETAGEPGSATYSLSVDGAAFAFAGLLNASNTLPDGTTVDAVAGVAPSYLVGDIFVFSTPGSPDYVQGDDIESDPALAQRCRYRWPSLALNVLDAKAILWAVTAYPSINRASVNPSTITPGQWIITVADSHGGIDAAGLGVIESYARARLGVGEGMSAAAASDVLVNAYGNARVPRGTSPAGIQTIQKTATAAWVAYLASVPIGPSSVYAAKLVEILLDAGCVDAGDVSQVLVNLEADSFSVPIGSVPVAGSLIKTSPNPLAPGLSWMSA